MSPTEDDLRSALSDGAGDVPDTERIMFAATQQRAARQKRLLSVAAAVVVVGGVATGAGFLAHHNRSTESAGGGGAAAEPARDAVGGPATAADGEQPATTMCPSKMPASTTFGGADGTGKLFAEPVSSAVVCAYPTVGTTGPIKAGGGGTSSTPSSITLNGADATTLTDSLENAAKVRPGTVCPDIRLADQETIVVLAKASDGTELTPVTTTINEVACAVVVSNGSAVRYAWAPPAALHRDFAGLTGSGRADPGSVPAGGISSGSPTVNGTPAR